MLVWWLKNRGKCMAKQDYNPKLIVEAALSLFRLFSVILFFIVAFNNAIWYAAYHNRGSGGAQINMTQGGTSNTGYTQSITTADINK